MDDLDFSSPAGSQKRPTQAAPIYNAAIARAFFESTGRLESVPAGTRLFSENQKASRILLQRDRMYLLLEGKVSLSANGDPLGTVKPGEVFGEMAAITESPRSATATAATDCQVISLDDKQFQSALQKTPEFALMLMSIMINRLRGMLSRLTGIPTATEAKETRVFDKGLLAGLARGLGDNAAVRYERGKVIMIQGQVGNLMYVVLEGRVAISLRGSVIERVGPGGVFGEMALVDQVPRAANAAAETDCTLLAMNRAVFLNLVKADPVFGVSLLTAVAERVRSMAADVN